MSLFLKLTS